MDKTMQHSTGGYELYIKYRNYHSGYRKLVKSLYELDDNTRNVLS